MWTMAANSIAVHVCVGMVQYFERTAVEKCRAAISNTNANEDSSPPRLLALLVKTLSNMWHFCECVQSFGWVGVGYWRTRSVSTFLLLLWIDILIFIFLDIWFGFSPWIFKTLVRVPIDWIRTMSQMHPRTGSAKRFLNDISSFYNWEIITVS